MPICITSMFRILIHSLAICVSYMLHALKQYFLKMQYLLPTEVCYQTIILRTGLEI